MTSRLQSSGIAALSFTLSAAVLALALTPSVASAATTELDPIELTGRSERVVESRRVNAGDLDLNTASGLKTLNGRISRAINQVCRDPGNDRLIITGSDCAYEARVSADQQIAALRSSSRMAAAASAVSAARTITVVAPR